MRGRSGRKEGENSAADERDADEFLEMLDKANSRLVKVEATSATFTGEVAKLSKKVVDGDAVVGGVLCDVYTVTTCICDGLRAEPESETESLFDACRLQ